MQENRHLTRLPGHAAHSSGNAEAGWLDRYGNLGLPAVAGDLRAQHSSNLGHRRGADRTEPSARGIPVAHPLENQQHAPSTSTMSQCSRLGKACQCSSCRDQLSANADLHRNTSGASLLLPQQRSSACSGQHCLWPREAWDQAGKLHDLEARLSAQEGRLSEASSLPRDVQLLRQEVAGLRQAQLHMQAGDPASYALTHGVDAAPFCTGRHAEFELHADFDSACGDKVQYPLGPRHVRCTSLLMCRWCRGHMQREVLAFMGQTSGLIRDLQAQLLKVQASSPPPTAPADQCPDTGAGSGSSCTAPAAVPAATHEPARLRPSGAAQHASMGMYDEEAMLPAFSSLGAVKQAGRSSPDRRQPNTPARCADSTCCS